MAGTEGGGRPVSPSGVEGAEDASIAALFAEAVASVERHAKRPSADGEGPGGELPSEEDGFVLDVELGDLPVQEAVPDVDAPAEPSSSEVLLLQEELAKMEQELVDTRQRLKRREADIAGMLKRFEDAQKLYRVKVREAELAAEKVRETQEQSDARALEIKRLIERLKKATEQVEAVRRRAQREKEELQQFGMEKPFRSLLAVIDNLERALHHGAGDLKVLHEGVEMILLQLLGLMGQHGVSAVEVEPGRTFDPTWQEAMVRVPTNTMPSGCVVEVLQKGYRYRDRLLRAALVSVSQPDSSAEAADTSVSIEDTDERAIVLEDTEGGAGSLDGDVASAASLAEAPTLDEAAEDELLDSLTRDLTAGASAGDDGLSTQDDGEQTP